MANVCGWPLSPRTGPCSPLLTIPSEANTTSQLRRVSGTLVTPLHGHSLNTRKLTVYLSPGRCRRSHHQGNEATEDGALPE